MKSNDSDYSLFMDGHESELSDTNCEISDGASIYGECGSINTRPKKARRKPARVKSSDGDNTRRRLKHRLIFDQQCDRCAKAGQACVFSNDNISARKCDVCRRVKQTCLVNGVNVRDLPHLRPHKPERKEVLAGTSGSQLVVELIEIPMDDVERSSRNIPERKQPSYAPGSANLPIQLQDDSEMEDNKPNLPDPTDSRDSMVEDPVNLGPAAVRILKTAKEGILRCQLKCQALSSKKSVEYFSATAAVLADKVKIEVASPTTPKPIRQLLDKLAKDLRSVAKASSTSNQHHSYDDSDDWLRACATCETLFECCLATIDAYIS